MVVQHRGSGGGDGGGGGGGGGGGDNGADKTKRTGYLESVLVVPVAKNTMEDGVGST